MPPSSPDDEVGPPLRVLVEDVVDAVQRRAKLGHVKRGLHLGQHVRLGVAGLWLCIEKLKRLRMSASSKTRVDEGITG